MMKIAGIVAASVASLALLEGCKSEADELKDFQKNVTALAGYKAKFKKIIDDADDEKPITNEQCTAQWTALKADKDLKDLKKNGDAVHANWTKLAKTKEGDRSEEQKKTWTADEKVFEEYATARQDVVEKMNDCFHDVAEEDRKPISPEDIKKVLPEYEEPTAKAD